MTKNSDTVTFPAGETRILTPGLGLFLLGVVIVLVLARSTHYLLFHTLAELISIAVSLSIFTLTWASRQHLKNGYLVILGAAYISIGIVDIFHTLTFKGMSLLPGVTSNYPTQFWLTARFIEAAALVVAPQFIRRPPNFTLATWAFALPGALGCIAVLNGVLPTTYVEGIGLTQFKIVSEYVIILMLLTAQLMLWRHRKEFLPQVFGLLSGSLLLAIATEFCFIHYVGFYDFVNEVGHFFRFLSVVLAYLALVVIGVRRPAEILYRQLVRKDDELQRSNEQLHMSEDMLNKAQAVAGVGSWHMEIPGNRLSWSDETYRIFGVPPGTPQSFETFAAHIHPDDLSRVNAAWDDAVHKGFVYDIEHRILVHGDVLWVRERAEIERNADGEPIAGHGTVQDINQNMLDRQRLELALAGADLGLWDLDIPSGRFTHNPRLIGMLGYAPGEIAVDATTFAAHLHPADGPRFRSAFYAHLKGQTPNLEVEYRVCSRDDRWVWLLSHGKVVERDETGRAVRMIGTNLDISERKQSEVALKARETRLATLIASMQEIVIVFDTDGRVVEYFHPPHSNRPAYKRREDLLGKTYVEILPVAVARQVDEAIAGIMTDGKSQTFQYSLTIDGREYWSQATMSPLLGESKYPTGFLKVIRDITAERTAQEEIERLARTNTLLLESVGNGVCGVNMAGHTTFVNSTALAMLGFTEAELLGHEQHPLFHHHHQDGTPYPIDECPIRLTRVDGQVRHVDNEWFWRKDGSGFPVALTVTPLVENGNQVGAVVIFQDISERKANEAKIHDLAFYDHLTKLPNRRLLLDRLGLALLASARRNTYGAVLFLDLDNFKVLNDSKGHEFGDLLLVEAARRLLSCVRAEDTVARLGGDEFVVTLEDLSSESGQAVVQAEAIGEKIRNALSAVYSLPGYSHHCSSSIGVCLFKGAEVDVGELLKRADMAMYQAKSAGRNTVRFFQQGR